jgi:imidazolonepropionase
MRLKADLILTNIGQLLTMAPPGAVTASFGGAASPPGAAFACSASRSGVTSGHPTGLAAGGPAARTGDPGVKLIGLIQDAVVVVAGGIIVAAGPRTEIEPLLDEPGTACVTIDAGRGVVTPGLIDSHTHLLFAGWREAEFTQRLQGRPYLEILAQGGGILRSVARFREASDEVLLAHGRSALNRMLRSGTTTVEAKSGYGLNREQELRTLRLYRRLSQEHPVDLIPTFLGAHAVPADFRDRVRPAAAYLDEVCLPLLPEIAAGGLARFCDVFCEEGIFSVEDARRLLTTAASHGLGLKLHADEIEPMGGAELAAEVAAVSADHLARASEEGLRRMAAASVTAVLLPTTLFTLGRSDYAPARKMLDLGLEVALATDFNPGTSPVESLAVVMGVACRTMRLTPAEAFRACTTGAARAVGLGGKAGEIRPGLPADLVVFEASDYRQVAYRLGAELVRTVVKNGLVVVENGKVKARRMRTWF